MFIFYGLYFDSIDKYWRLLLLFPYFQYLVFSFDGDELDEFGDKGRYPFARFSCTSSFVCLFFYSVHVLTFITEAYDWIKKSFIHCLYTLPIYRMCHQSTDKFQLKFSIILCFHQSGSCWRPRKPDASSKQSYSQNANVEIKCRV